MRGLAASSLASLLLLASCSKPAGAVVDSGPAETGTDSLPVLRESARELLDTNCGECHTRGLDTALPRALAVYDLTDLDWSRHMSAAQLREADRRLHEPLAPTRGEGEVRLIKASEAELARFRRYVELESGLRDR